MKAARKDEGGRMKDELKKMQGEHRISEIKDQEMPKEFFHPSSFILHPSAFILWSLPLHRAFFGRINFRL
jgi:hypothetical protein